jgi:hypothetical protein
MEPHKSKITNSPRSSIKEKFDLFSASNGSHTVSFEKYSFVTKSLIIASICCVFTFLFIIVAGIIGIMVSYFLSRYNLIEKVLTWQLWQKIVFFGGFLFFIANFCLFEAEAIVNKVIQQNQKPTQNDELKNILKIRPKNWQKIIYGILLLGISILIGYLFIINYINWSYNQFWN